MNTGIIKTIEQIRRKRQMRLDADGDDDNQQPKKPAKKHSTLSTRLPYGIAKDLGIETEGLTPREVWDKIGGKGISHNAAMSTKTESPDKKVDISAAKAPKKTLSKMTASDFPTNLSGSKIGKQETVKFCDKVNSAVGTDSSVGKLYRSMKALHDKCKSSVIQYAERKHVAADKGRMSVRYSMFSGKLIKAEVKVPKITDDKTAMVAAHEFGHYLDALGGGDNVKDYMSTSSNAELSKAVWDERISDKSGLKKERLTMFQEISDKAGKAFSDKIKELNGKLDGLNKKFNSKEISYDDYNKQWNKVKKEGLAEANEAEWKEDNGASKLMDMYDAMSHGVLQATGLRYGHGRKYYSETGAPEKELFANYCTLSVFRPDLLKYFEEDFPKTTEALKKHVDKLLEMAEG